ncbi:CUE domain-containing protein 3 [Cyberlindnera fabianii]|uniref:CUE domain-containing protein 3 n=1 Tax=Cyberlindnera fabianii TaxID=36022 RepID=A0A1V2L7A0_CYBFA|nr:CUE domain-containing protein 3 [Cyberlindnera fabianii]
MRSDPVDFSTEIAPADLPIAAFPPFKLRSSMVDTDPVIWVHLIEVFVQYVQAVLNIKVPLTERSEQQLCLFVKSYLHEIAEEQGQLLSLGHINVQITENLETLRCWMFELIKDIGVLRLKLNGEALWDFAKVYGLKNTSAVTGLIDGRLKPRDKKSICSNSQVQKHLEYRITNGKFDKYDMQIYAALMSSGKQAARKNQKNQNGGSSKVVRKQKGQQPQLFTDMFLTVSWFEILERLYSKGEGRFATTVKDISVISLVSSSVSRVAALAAELGISTYHSLGLYPLFAAIVTAPAFDKLNPGLKSKLPFLRQRGSRKAPVNEADVETLIDMFPTLTFSHTEHLLRKNSNSVEQVTMMILQDPNVAIPPEETKGSRHVNTVNPSADSIVSKKVINKGRHSTTHVPDEAKNKTLAAALRLMYESDEDEHDDTYDEAEATAGAAAAAGEQSKYDKLEKYLWEIFKKDPGAFEQVNRKGRKRKEMKDETKWSDEQIEGWARMIQKSPKRAKILEEKYMFRGNKPERSSFRREQDSDEARSTPDVSHSQSQQTQKTPQRGNAPQKGGKANDKRQQARNEKNKASRANHNRKAGHDKKMAKGM